MINQLLMGYCYKSIIGIWNRKLISTKEENRKVLKMVKIYQWLKIDAQGYIILRI
jgi:hypothetical protein